MMADFKDISARLKSARAEDAAGEAAADRPIDYGESYRIRAKMVGVLIRDARVNAGRTPADCAQMLRVAPEQIEQWEFGESTPSLPQLELLAYYLDVPVSHFWGMHTLQSSRDDPAAAQREYLALRDRLIGALLRQAREELGLSVADLAALSGMTPAQLEQYELGEVALPMHELTVLANGVRKNMDYFLESSSKIGELLRMREAWKHFTALPEDLRQFAANPLNLGFIEIALMFSQMPTDKLRRVGESVLNITM
ncbi:MAG: transcriptional regulator [Chloroflexi bacterium]|nr:transcriptional regulator [Chloroflexota bacterium]